MKVMLDINIIIDIMLDREPFSRYSKIIFSLIEKRQISGYISATAPPIIYYLVKKHASKEKAEEVIDILLSVFEVAVVNKDVIKRAKDLGFSDFEDALVYSSAEKEGIEFLITRNIKDFPKKGNVKVLSSEEFLTIIGWRNE